MPGFRRPDVHKSASLLGGLAGVATASGSWPLPTPFAADVGASIGRGTAFEANFERPDDYALALPSRAKAAKVLMLIDSVRLTRECLAHLLASQLADYEIVSVAHAQQAAESSGVRPDVVLLNVGSARLADAPLLGDIGTIFAATRRAPMLLLSEHGDPSEESQAAEFGMVGLFPSAFGIALLIAAIQLVVAGGQFHIPVAPIRHPLSQLEGNVTRR